ncbi:MAG TPA: rod shape-determining protein RodA [Bacteroidales bacterium]|jgi:rod shape determining protein RodA|nr:rod shape-determining protein RodA [Bacteroidales bacterium]HNZ42430.1 rod shape-determining protein RodA [Bacteroidales bacterium]HPI30272.1 rod shape-determining protein RodA [Bacteroidales bacterium]
MSTSRNTKANIDWVLIALYVFFIFIGLMNIYSAGYSEEHKAFFDFSQEHGKQMIWMAAALLVALCVMVIDARFFSTFAYIIYGLAILLLLITLFIGKEIHGSCSWIVITESVRFQPLELAKFATNLALAKFLSSIDIRIQDLSTRVKAFAMLAVPVIIILLQNETGSMLVFAAFIFVLYREGLSGNVLIIGFAMIFLFIFSLLINKFIVSGFILAVAVLLFFFIRRSRKNIMNYSLIVAGIIAFVFSVNLFYEHALQPHQQKRIDVLLGKISDVKDAGYNVNQSKIAIGSGGFFGRGFLHGTQTKFKFVPEQNTDFIFCTIGEEWGFVGSLLVLGVFVFFILRILFIAERQRSAFSRIYGYGLASIIFFHVVINIGMTIGLAPVVGIPLPFISYGGSSLLAFTLLLFVFIKQDASRMQVL